MSTNDKVSSLDWSYKVVISSPLKGKATYQEQSWWTPSMSVSRTEGPAEAVCQTGDSARSFDSRTKTATVSKPEMISGAHILGQALKASTFRCCDGHSVLRTRCAEYFLCCGSGAFQKLVMVLLLVHTVIRISPTDASRALSECTTLLLSNSSLQKFKIPVTNPDLLEQVRCETSPAGPGPLMAECFSSRSPPSLPAAVRASPWRWISGALGVACLVLMAALGVVLKKCKFFRQVS
ncbi:hypothetical protein J0S82_000317 [Galemys pyrenaicus]|uniref:Uncharacterized protein n=1 Tax=Galemys pyrenaicus TaxID=202257 RepID=A0A8J6DGA3_GALPY|nr:hypothetical protein J0S82_000317 [Galemys pyrenaicus]